MDYPNHILTHPAPWDSPEAVEVLLYLDDVQECEGATHVVPRCGQSDPAYQWPYTAMPGVGRLRYVNDRTTIERYLQAHDPEMHAFRQSLYDRAKAVQYTPGVALLYRHDVWHRGTPVAAGVTRTAVNLVYRKASAGWISNWDRGPAYNVYFSTDRMLLSATPEQRSLLGIPLPTDRYWTTQMIEAVEQRFGWDMAAYRAAQSSTAS